MSGEKKKKSTAKLKARNVLKKAISQPNKNK